MKKQKPKPRRTRMSHREFAKLWIAASDELMGDLLSDLLKSIDDHEIKSAVLSGAVEEDIHPALTEKRAFETLARLLTKRCGEHTTIKVKPGPPKSSLLCAIELHAKPSKSVRALFEKDRAAKLHR